MFNGDLCCNTKHKKILVIIHTTRCCYLFKKVFMFLLSQSQGPSQPMHWPWPGGQKVTLRRCQNSRLNFFDIGTSYNRRQKSRHVVRGITETRVVFWNTGPSLRILSDGSIMYRFAILHAFCIRSWKKREYNNNRQTDEAFVSQNSVQQAWTPCPASC